MKKVPFFANYDDMHCYEAAFQMVLKYFLPEREFTIKELEQMTGKLPGLSTWPHHMLMKLGQMGFQTEMIENFDAQAFVKEGAAYLMREYGEETAAWQIKNSDIPYEQKTYKTYLSTMGYAKRAPKFNDIANYLANGYLVICLVNSRKLNGKSGYSGHAVVVYSIDEGYVHFHDPGQPPHIARKATLQEFEAAWAYPNNEAKGLIAITKKDNNG